MGLLNLSSSQELLQSGSKQYLFNRKVLLLMLEMKGMI